MNMTDRSTKPLYKAVSVAYARHIVTDGFIGITSLTWADDDLECKGESIGTLTYVEFRDIPPAGLTASLTTEKQVEVAKRVKISKLIAVGRDLLVIALKQSFRAT